MNMGTTMFTHISTENRAGVCEQVASREAVKAMLI